MLSAGDAIEGTGLAGALQTAVRTAFYGNDGFPSAEAERQTAVFNNMLATVLIDYITANMEVVITTETSGLQQTINPLMVTVDTLAPAAEKTLTVR